MATLDPLWYIFKNEITGGWAIMSENHPPREHHDPDEIATFVHEPDAREILAIHNDKYLSQSIIAR